LKNVVHAFFLFYVAGVYERKPAVNLSPINSKFLNIKQFAKE